MGEIMHWRPEEHDQYFVLAASDEAGAYAVVGEPPEVELPELTLASFRRWHAAYAEAATISAAVHSALTAWEGWKVEGRRSLCLEAGRRVLLLGDDHICI